VNLSIYLLAGERTSVDNIVPASKLAVGGFQPLSPRNDLPFPSRAFLKTTPGHPPDWRAWVDSGFDLGDRALLTSGHGCLVLLLVKRRVFAACFGSGWSAVTRDLIEPDFGLTVALSQVDASRLRHLVTKNLERKTRERSTYRHGGGSVSDFAVDLEVEWLRSAGGKTQRQDCSVIAGADALKITGWKGPIRRLHAACGEFLRLFEKGVPARFQFANNLRPIKATSPQQKELDDEVLTLLRAGKLDRLSVSVDANVALRMSQAKLKSRGATVVVPDFDDDGLAGALEDLANEAGAAFDPAAVVVTIVDENDQTLLEERLERLLQAEIKKDGKLYVRMEGSWFLANRSYVKTVNAHIARIDDATSRLKMPPWKAAESEGAYNIATAKRKKWLLQDQVLIAAGGGQVEPCDLLTQDRDLICIKKGRSSSALSHLFAQASGSADLLARESSYAAELGKRYSEHFGQAFDAPGRPRFIVAIGRPKGEDLFGKMILSKINALEHIRRIRSNGFEVAFCKIEHGSPKS
jgi:uncharacterized protein (TIGR04141 family)